VATIRFCLGPLGQSHLLQRELIEGFLLYWLLGRRCKLGRYVCKQPIEYYFLDRTKLDDFRHDVSPKFQTAKSVRPVSVKNLNVENCCSGAEGPVSASTNGKSENAEKTATKKGERRRFGKGYKA
jgi:hypothetical protein